MSQIEPDHNPYAPPSAELGEMTAAPRTRVGWKIYLWLMVGLSVLVYVSLGVQWMQPVDIIDIGITAVSLVGMFGFAYRRRIAKRSFWRTWLPVQVLWDLTVILLFTPAGLAYRLPDFETSSAFSLETVAGLLILLPLYVAIYRYAHRSPELWLNGPADPLQKSR